MENSELWINDNEHVEYDFGDEDRRDGNATFFTLDLGRTGQQGGFHIRNKQGERQRGTVSAFGAGSKKKPAFRVNCIAKAIVHGTLDEISRKPATLLIYDFSFFSYRSTRIKEADITFEFQGASAPTVKKVAPYSKHVMMQTTQQESRTLGAEAGVDVNFNTKINTSRTIDKITTHAVEVIGDNPSDDWGNCALAQWFLKENASQAGGIVTRFRTCMLIVRKNDAEFYLIPTIEAKPDFKTWLGSIFSTRTPDDPILLDPTIEPYVDLEDMKDPIDQWNLGTESLDSLWDCTFHSTFGQAVKVSKSVKTGGSFAGVENVQTVEEAVQPTPGG